MPSQFQVRFRDAHDGVRRAGGKASRRRARAFGGRAPGSLFYSAGAMITARWITLATPDGPMEAFVALPEPPGSRPAVVLCQEAFGVNDHIRDVCRRVARGAPRDAGGGAVARRSTPRPRPTPGTATRDFLALTMPA